MFGKIKQRKPVSLVAGSRAVVSALAVLVLTLLGPAHPVQLQDPCVVKKQYDDAEAKSKKKELEDPLSFLLDPTSKNNRKQAYDTVIMLKDRTLKDAEHKLAEPFKIARHLLEVPELDLLELLADWKTWCADYQTRAVKWEKTPNEQTLGKRDQLVQEREFLLSKQEQLKEIIQSCQKMDQMATDLMEIRARLEPYRCFEDVALEISTIDMDVPLLKRFSLPSTAKCPPLEDLDVNLKDLANVPVPHALDDELDALRESVEFAESTRLIINTDMQMASNLSGVTTKLETALANLREFKKQKEAKKQALCRYIEQNESSNLKAKIESSATQAEAKQTESSRLVSDALSLSANCASVDLKAVRDRYSRIRSLAQEIAQLKTAAEQDSARLDAIAKAAASAASEIIAERASVTISELEEMWKLASSDFEFDKKLDEKDAKRRTALDIAKEQIPGKINDLRMKFRQSGRPDVKEKLDELDELQGQLSSATANLDKVYPLEREIIDPAQPRNYYLKAKTELGHIREYKAEGVSILQEPEKGFPCDTNIPSAAAALQRLARAAASVENDPSRAAEFLRQAQVCDASRKCIPVIDQARQLLERLQIEDGVAAINQARQQGCNVAGLENTLDYYRTIRDAAALLFNAKQQCKFQEGLAFAQKMPASIQNNPWISNGIEELRTGLATQQQVEQYITNATASASNGSSLALRHEYAESRKQFAQADGYLAQADQLAKSSACLVERVNKYRDEYNRLKKSVNYPREEATTSESTGDPTSDVPAALGTSNPTDEVPQALGRPTGALGAPLPPLRPKEPKYQSPTSDVPGALGPGQGKQPPSDAVPGALESGTGKQTPTNNVPTVIGSTTNRPKVDDDTGKSSDGNKQSQPRDPNKPGKAERAGRIIGGILTGIARQRTNQGGGTGGTTGGGNTGGGTNTGGGNAGKRDCTAGERASFAKMAGSWKSVVLIVTISGSCEQPTGKMTWAEYCSSVSDPKNTNRKYPGNFTGGQMEGGSLSIGFFLPGQGVHKDQNGRASCALNSDGTLSCRGFGCGGDLKKE